MAKLRPRLPSSVVRTFPVGYGTYGRFLKDQGKFGADLEDKQIHALEISQAPVYTPSLWETDPNEELRTGFVLKSWLGCC